MRSCMAVEMPVAILSGINRFVRDKGISVPELGRCHAKVGHLSAKNSLRTYTMYLRQDCRSSY